MIAETKELRNQGEEVQLECIDELELDDEEFDFDSSYPYKYDVLGGKTADEILKRVARNNKTKQQN